MRKKTIVLSIAAALVALIGIGVWWLFSTGRLSYVANPIQANDKMVRCDDTIVNRYNEASYFTLRGENKSLPTNDKEGLAKLTSDIRAKDGFASDATCLTILFYDAVRNDNYENATELYQALLDLHKQGVYANSNIRSNEPLFNYPDFFNILSGAPAREE